MSEREWDSANPNGTRHGFNEYYKNLSPEQHQVSWVVASDNSTDIAHRNLESRLQSKNRLQLKRGLRARSFLYLCSTDTN